MDTNLKINSILIVLIKKCNYYFSFYLLRNYYITFFLHSVYKTQYSDASYATSRNTHNYLLDWNWHSVCYSCNAVTRRNMKQVIYLSFGNCYQRDKNYCLYESVNERWHWMRWTFFSTRSNKQIKSRD